VGVPAACGRHAGWVKSRGGIQRHKLRRRRKIAGAYLLFFGGEKWHKSDEVHQRHV